MNLPILLRSHSLSYLAAASPHLAGGGISSLMEESSRRHSDHAVQCRTYPEALWQMIVVIRGVLLRLTTMVRPPRELFDSLRVIEGNALGGCPALLST